jgi:Ca2+-transporting ATPase
MSVDRADVVDRTSALVGLSSGEAAARLSRDGPNVVVPEGTRRRLKRLLGPLGDPMVALLLLAAPTYLLIGETTDAVVAFVALGPIAAVGWLLESRAERTLDRLRQLTAPTARVIRDGTDQSVPVEALVVGDLVLIHEGDVVPADAAVVELSQLLVDESALTGESLPASKQVATGDESMVWAGTTVLSGRGLVRVTAAGTATRYGRIGVLVAATRTPLTPLQRGLARLVRALAVLAAVFCVAVIAAELLHGDGWGDAVIAGVSLAIAAIPEEFSMIYTLYLALGAWRLAQHGALVRRLPSVETLGSTTVICTDKTGTLTHGRLAVAGIWTASGPRGDGGTLTDVEVQLLEAAVLACEPEPYDPLDVAIVDYARRHGIDGAALHRGRLERDWPFDPSDKYLTHVWTTDPCNGRPYAAAKGSVEGIVAHSAAAAELVADALAANHAYSSEGMRVIAVAAGPAPRSATRRSDDETELRMLGLVAFSDPVRDGVAEALGECAAAGIRVVMVTGDHPATAHAVAEGLGLPHEAAGSDLIATGDDLDAADGDGVEDLVANANVFARTRPEQKHQLVGALRRRGEVVAMTGDGINDAPALREADICVAMGQRGTAVAREAASLVLLDDNFATIVAAVRDGRRIFDNLTRAFAYLIAFHPPLLLGAVVIPLLGKPLFLLPIHLVVLELLLHPVVSLVFQADPPDRDIMRRSPRPVGDALRLRALARPYAVGIVLAVVLVAVYLVALAAWPEEQARGLAFASLLASQPALLLSMRSPSRPLWASGRPWTRTLTVIIATIAAATLAVIYLPPLASLLHLEPFPAAWWSVVVVIAGTTAWSEPLKRRHLPG